MSPKEKSKLNADLIRKFGVEPNPIKRLFNKESSRAKSKPFTKKKITKILLDEPAFNNSQRRSQFIDELTNQNIPYYAREGFDIGPYFGGVYTLSLRKYIFKKALHNSKKGKTRFVLEPLHYSLQEY
jgi:hypothetical protein